MAFQFSLGFFKVKMWVLAVLIMGALCNNIADQIHSHGACVGLD